jgi:hypothetical protein
MIPAQDRIADELAINQLVQRYAEAVDVLGGAAQAACFTHDGYFQLSSGARRDRAAMAAAGPAGDVRRRHFFMPPVIEFASADAASGSGFCLILEFDPATGAQGPPLSVDYRDAYRRTDEGWLFASRVVTRSFG